MSNNIKYYSLDTLKDYEDGQYYIIFGERSNGKSFAVNKRNIDRFFEYGEEFVICKRYSSDMKQNTAGTMLNDLADYILEKYEHKLKFYRGIWYVYHKESDGKLKDCKVLGHAMSLNECDRIKGGKYPNVTTIVLEEFMSIGNKYLPNEISLLINIVSSVFRQRINGKVFLLGNAISKKSPFSDALDIKLYKMKKNEIIRKVYTNEDGLKTTFIIQRTESVNVFKREDNVDNVTYNVFGDTGIGAMVTTGEFETNKYPRVVDNHTFFSILKELPKSVMYDKNSKTRRKNKGYDILDKGTNYATPFYIRFDDTDLYRIYLKREGQELVGFLPCDKIVSNNSNKNGYKYILNNDTYIQGVINVNDLSTFATTNDILNQHLNSIMRAMLQKSYVFTSDDEGEDIINAFREVKFNL